MIRRVAMRPTFVGSMLAMSLGGLAWLARPPADLQPFIMLLAAGQSAQTQKLVDGAQAAARRYRVDLNIETAGDVRRQNELLARAEQIMPDAVIVCPVDPRGQGEPINKLVPLTHVVACQDDAPQTNRRLYVGRGDYAVGHVGGLLVRRLLSPGGNVALVWDECCDAHLSRLEGLQDALARPALGTSASLWRIAVRINDRGSDLACQRRLEQALVDHPDLACLICVGARRSELAARVLAEHDARDVKFIVIEPTDATMDQLALGRIDAVVTVDPYRIGYAAVARTAALCRSTPLQFPVPGLGAVHIQPEVITRDTLAAFRGRSSADPLATFN